MLRHRNRFQAPGSIGCSLPTSMGECIFERVDAMHLYYSRHSPPGANTQKANNQRCATRGDAPQCPDPPLSLQTDRAADCHNAGATICLFQVLSDEMMWCSNFQLAVSVFLQSNCMQSSERARLAAHCRSCPGCCCWWGTGACGACGSDSRVMNVGGDLEIRVCAISHSAGINCARCWSRNCQNTW